MKDENLNKEKTANSDLGAVSSLVFKLFERRN